MWGEDQHITSGKTDVSQSQENCSPEYIHSTAGLRVSHTQEDNSRKERIEWAPIGSKEEWAKFEDVSRFLETTDNAWTNRVECMCKVIYEIGSERFGIRKTKVNGKQMNGPGRIAQQITKMKADVKALRNAWKRSSAEERASIEELSKKLRKKLMRMVRAERLCKKKREKRKTYERFFKDPFKFAKGLRRRAEI